MTAVSPAESDRGGGHILPDELASGRLIDVIPEDLLRRELLDFHTQMVDEALHRALSESEAEQFEPGEDENHRVRRSGHYEFNLGVRIDPTGNLFSVGLDAIGVNTWPSVRTTSELSPKFTDETTEEGMTLIRRVTGNRDKLVDILVDDLTIAVRDPVDFYLQKAPRALTAD